MPGIPPPRYHDPLVTRLLDQGDALCARSVAIQAQADALHEWVRRLQTDSLELIEALRESR
jgi:hypothetical protein